VGVSPLFISLDVHVKTFLFSVHAFFAMVNTSSGIDRLPPAERLKRLRELEAEKKKTLDEELAKKRELEDLEQKTKEELDETKDLEKKTLEEIEEKGQEQLEERIKEFRKKKEFVEEDESGITYEPIRREGQHAPGKAASLYETPAFRQATEGIDYLLHAEGASEERQVERERSLYQNVRWMEEQMRQGRVEEGYAFNRIQEQMQHLKERGDPHGYVARIENVLNSIVDYRQQDEERQKQA